MSRRSGHYRRPQNWGRVEIETDPEKLDAAHRHWDIILAEAGVKRSEPTPKPERRS